MTLTYSERSIINCYPTFVSCYNGLRILRHTDSDPIVQDKSRGLFWMQCHIVWQVYTWKENKERSHFMNHVTFFQRNKRLLCTSFKLYLFLLFQQLYQVGFLGKLFMAWCHIANKHVVYVQLDSNGFMTFSPVSK